MCVVCMCVHMCECMYVCVCVHTYVHVWLCISVCGVLVCMCVWAGGVGVPANVLLISPLKCTHCNNHDILLS